MPVAIGKGLSLWSRRQVLVTLWGSVGEDMINMKGPDSGPYVCILTATSPKKYFGELGISSTSSTQIIDGPDVPVLKSFVSALSNQDLSEIPLAKVDTLTTVDTLAELMKWGRKWKNGMHPADGRILFKKAIEILDIQTRNGWYLITCSSGRCRKGLTRVQGGFWCGGCKSSVLYPHIRYILMCVTNIRFKIQMDVKDESMAVVVTLFAEPAEQLLFVFTNIHVLPYLLIM